MEESKAPQPEHESWQPPTPLFTVLYWARRIWRRIENIVFGLVLLLVLLYFVLQLPVVQNWLIQKTTAYLSEEFKTSVRIRHIDVSFFDNLLLEGFYVADQKGDTLLFAEKLTAGLNSNILSLLANKLEFDEIGLTNARFNLRRAEGEYENNLYFILAHPWFSSKKPPSDKPKSPFSLRIQNLFLENVEFRQEDWVKGRRMVAHIPEGRIRVNNLDVNSKIADIQSVTLDGFHFDFEDHPSKPLPEISAPENTPDNALPIVQKVDTLLNAKPRQFFVFKIHDFRLSDGRFELDKFHLSPGKETQPEVMDFNHMDIRELEIMLDSVQFNDDLAFSGKIRHFSAREALSGFVLKHAEVRQAFVTDKRTQLYGLLIQTEHSMLGDTFEMSYSTYRDFRKFNNNVVMSGRFSEGSHIRLGDLTHFSDPVARNAFIKKNSDEVAQISGSMNGLVNKLNGRDLKIRLAKGTEIDCDFDGDDMARNPELMRIGLKFRRLQSNMKTLRDIIPGFRPPAYFDKLGNFVYDGNYQLLFGYNHILTGNIRTDIGNGTVDMELDLTGGKEKATYSGYLNMNRFDLAAWTSNRQFGKTTFRVNIAEGSSGLTLPTINATLSGTLDTFTFRDYTYRKVLMNGHFSRHLFEGKLGVEDPNLNFTFDGTINVSDTTPVYNFKADLKRLDLGALNLLQKNWVVSAKVPYLNLRGKKIEDISGQMSLRNLRIVQDKKEVHVVDSIGFQSLVRPNGTRYFGLNSEVAAGYLDGDFDLASAPAHLLKIFSRHYPAFAERLGLPKDDSLAIPDNYLFNLRIIDTKSLTRLAEIGLDTLRDVQAIGRIEGQRGFTNLNLEVPALRINSVELQQISLSWDGLKDRGNYELYVHQTLLGKRRLAPIRLFGKTESQKIGFNLQAQNVNNILKNINLSGGLSLADSVWQVSFNPSDITLFNESWFMDENNHVRFGKGFFATQNFDLFNGDKRIFLDSMANGRGLRMGLTNFDLNFLDNFLKFKDVTYRGKIYDFDLAIQDVFKLQGMSLYVNTDTLFVKNKAYGFITGNLDMEHLSAPLVWKLNLVDKNHRLRLAGGWLPGGKTPLEVPEIGLVKPKEIQLQADATDFPLDILQQFIPGISGTAGKFDAAVRLGGPFNRLGMDGSALVHEGSFQINYLRSFFHVREQKIALTNNAIWATGDTIWDNERQSMAFVRGGLRHDHFRDWRIDCDLLSADNNFKILNTAKGENATFYGQGIGWFKARFSGTFSRTDIKIDAVTGKETRLFIPLTGAEDTQEVSFIKFKPKNPQNPPENAPPYRLKSFTFSDLKGLNFEMNLSITDDAEVQMIFDEQAGDLVRGRGEGDINLVINREGEFRMYGNYTIRRGEYLFTLLNFVNKPFTVASGGTITWFGDPYNAEIALDARYDATTPVYNFLQEELEVLSAGGTDDPRVREAQKATRTTVVMHLKGDLFKPKITFDLEFPNLPNELRTLTDNKLRLLRQDPNQLNRQVFGLVVLGSFLPSSSSALLQNGDIGTTAVATFTQFLSTQFSSYLSSLAGELLGKTFSSLDFNVAYNEYRSSLTNGGSGLNQAGRELQVRMSSGLANDRVRINIGSQFGLGGSLPGTVTNDGFLGEDVTIEFQLTENRQWRLKIYQRLEPDIAGGARRQRYGLGVAFNKDYESFDEMIKGAKGWFRKKS